MNFIYASMLKDETMNGATPYRVKFSYGVFSIRPRHSGSGIYFYAYKRAARKLFKVYVGVSGKIGKERLHLACLKLLTRCENYQYRQRQQTALDALKEGLETLDA